MLAQGGSNMKKSAFTKDESLALKAVAILLIIMHHSISGNGVYWGFTHNFFPFAESQLNHIGAYCKIGVGIFAFITGYGITKKYRNSEKTVSWQAFAQYTSFIKKFLPVFAICLCATFLIDGRPMTVYIGQSPLHTIVNVLLDGFGQAKLMGTPSLERSWWYLSAIVVFSFAAPIFRRTVRRMGWLLPFFALIAFPRAIGMKISTEQPFYFLMAVLLGVIFAEYDLFEWLDDFQIIKTKWEFLNRLMRAIIATAVVLASYKAFHHLPNQTFWEWHWAFAPLIFILFFREWMHFIPALERPLSWLGKHSANIYFVHGLLLGYYLRNFLFSMPLLILTPFATYAVSLAFSLIIEVGKSYFYKKVVIQREPGAPLSARLRGYWHSESIRVFASPCLFAAMLLLLDLRLRGLHPGIGVTAVFDPIPQRFTLVWVLMITAVTLMLPKLFRKIAIGVTGGAFLLLFLVHSMMMQAKGNFFSFNSLMYAADGFRYLDASYIRVSSQIWLTFFLGVLILTLAILLTPKERFSIRRSIVCVLLIAIGIWGVNDNREKNLTSRLENHFNIYQNSLLYDNFTDPNACLMLCGMYQYTFRDFCVTYGVYDWFGQLNAKDKMEKLDAYYQNRELDPDNEWTGRFAGKNLILIQLEAIDTWMINEQFMPNLYSIQQQSLNFTSRYAPMYSDAGTFNTEMLVNTGMVAPFVGAKSSMYSRNDYPYSLANLMRAAGYRANSFHRSPASTYNRGVIHENWGYEKYYSGADMEIPDEELDFDTALMRAYDLITPDEPFLSFIVTYSAHGPYEHDALSDYYFDTAKECLPPDTDEMIIHAMARAKVTDELIGQLYDRLEADELLENTVLAFYSDHYDYYVQKRELILDIKGVEDFDMASHTPFFIYEKNTAPQEITKAISSIDILPTLVNLFGLDTDGRYYVGNDAFSSNGGYAIFKNFSWYDGETYWNTTMPGELTPEIQARNEEITHRLEMSWDAMKVNYFSL